MRKKKILGRKIKKAILKFKNVLKKRRGNKRDLDDERINVEVEIKKDNEKDNGDWVRGMSISKEFVLKGKGRNKSITL